MQYPEGFEPQAPPGQALRIGNLLLDMLVGQFESTHFENANLAFQTVADALLDLQEAEDRDEWDVNLISVTSILLTRLTTHLASARDTDVFAVISDLRGLLRMAETPGALAAVISEGSGVEAVSQPQLTQSRLIFLELPPEAINAGQVVDLDFVDTAEFTAVHGTGWKPVSHSLQPTHGGQVLLSVLLSRKATKE